MKTFDEQKNEFRNSILTIGGIAAMIGGGYIGHKKGLGFLGIFGISILAASPFVVARIVLAKKEGVSLAEQSKQNFEEMRQEVMYDYV